MIVAALYTPEKQGKNIIVNEQYKDWEKIKAMTLDNYNSIYYLSELLKIVLI